VPRPRAWAAVLGAATCAAVLALALEPPAPERLNAAMPAGSSFTLLQMNLCLSGLAECYDPAVVEEAAARIGEARPDAVTLNEACRGDAERIARETGYHLRFSRVIYLGAPLRCVRPGGRGRFGDAVLTAARPIRAKAHDFRSQEGIERRRWLCVATRAGVDVCTAHLNTRMPGEIRGNDAQCAELAALLARRAAAARTVAFGGDVNRPDPCAPRGFSARTDRTAAQAPGLQHVYASGGLPSPSASVLPTAHTDHDILLVRFTSPTGRPRARRGRL
jgi:endonuclease/exonuclease/phosphatase (EEP) superfamily protein YafD